MSLTKDAGENLDEMLELTTLELAPDWDTILVIPDDENKKPALRCMVSSSILMNQMPYFRALFTSGSRGLAFPKGEKPEISLLGDDPDAMRVILSIMHGKLELRRHDVLSSLKILSVARHYDKYCCDGIMSDWIDLWLHRMATTVTAREIGACIAAAYYFKCPKFIKVFVYRAIMYADEFSEGNAWIEDGINVASDIEDLLRQTTSQTVSEIKTIMQMTQCDFRFDPAGPEYLLLLETHIIWPFSRLLGSMTDVWAKMESAAMENPHYARVIMDLQVRMKDLVAEAQNKCDIDVQCTQSMQSLLRCNK